MKLYIGRYGPLSDMLGSYNELYRFNVNYKSVFDIVIPVDVDIGRRHIVGSTAGKPHPTGVMSMELIPWDP